MTPLPAAPDQNPCVLVGLVRVSEHAFSTSRFSLITSECLAPRVEVCAPQVGVVLAANACAGAGAVTASAYAVATTKTPLAQARRR